MKISPIRIAVTMLLGTVLAYSFSLKIICTIAIAAAVVIFSAKLAVKRLVDLGVLFMLLAFLISSFSCAYAFSNVKHKSMNYINCPVTLYGTVISSAKESAYNDNYKYTFRIKSVEHSLGIDNINDNILLTTPEKLNCGDSIKVCGTIKELPKKMNENGFDTAKFYKSKNIFTRIFSDETEPIDKIRVISPYALSEKVNETIDKIIYKYYSDDDAAVLSAIFTGNNTHFSNEYSDVLNKTAFKRLFHPAYIHIGIIIFLISLFRKIVKKQYRDIVTGLIFAGYALLQCTNIGFTRCLACAAVTIYYRWRYGASYFPDTLAYVVIFCTITVPNIIFNAAFVLSASGALIIWAFLPYVSAKLHFLPKFIRRTAAVMLICLVFLTPLSTYYYNGICTYSVLLPFITAPVIFLLLIITPITFLLLKLFGTAAIFGFCTDKLIYILRCLPYITVKLPLSGFNIKSPSLFDIFAIIFVILALYRLLHKNRKSAYRMFALAIVLIIPCITSNILRFGKIEFTFVNVGQGDGAIIQTPFRDTVIIDGGGGAVWNNYNPGKAVFLPYVQSKGINHIDAAIVSHFHQDHIQGIICTIENIKTDTVYAPQILENDSDSMKEWAKELERAAFENGTKVYYIAENTTVCLKSGITLNIYVPTENIRSISENNTSMPVKVDFGEFSAVYTGDMDKNAEESFMNETNVDADILKVSHHGSKNSSGEKFIAAVSPIYSVISCGENNVYNHPANETLSRLEDTTILRTDKLGDIKITADKNGTCRISNTLYQ